jgi:hypothetical protein
MATNAWNKIMKSAEWAYDATKWAIKSWAKNVVEWTKASLKKAWEWTLRKWTVATIKSLQNWYEWLAKITGSTLISNIIKNNPKSIVAGLSAVVTREWFQALWYWEAEIEEIKNDLSDSIWAWTTTPSNWIQTSQQDINPTYANQESEKTITWTNDAVNEIVVTIKDKLDKWEITKNEAREALTTVKEFANFNFDRSISDNLRMKWLDNSFEARWELANKLWIEWYEWTYNQNIQMLNSIRYMDNKEIQELLSK